ncbi:T6SS immunity protein Tdi1 domain-containing protein [Paenilisteria weihenstephanensis]|uniref:T6SS immunity protein Tdi1 domain-containing protein n=1 Tax=Listeria weihenstephanensis TaxID=1006155 RepID=UPI0016276DFD|nr:T6SS immunity protein Tdi1 domain-containing protein [Listeria weihenstephanensis]
MKNFKAEQAISEKTIEKYAGVVPEQVVAIWKSQGVGTMIDGYLKVIDPMEFEDILEESYIRFETAVPLFATAMGDLIVWEKNKYLNLLNFRRGTVNVIESGFEFFLDDLADKEFLDEELDWKPYENVVEVLGEPAYDECFGYVPLLALGGSEKVENLQKVKLREHILLISALAGKIE